MATSCLSSGVTAIPQSQQGKASPPLCKPNARYRQLRQCNGNVFFLNRCRRSGGNTSQCAYVVQQDCRVCRAQAAKRDVCRAGSLLGGACASTTRTLSHSTMAIASLNFAGALAASCARLQAMAPDTMPLTGPKAQPCDVEAMCAAHGNRNRGLPDSAMNDSSVLSLQPARSAVVASMFTLKPLRNPSSKGTSVC